MPEALLLRHGESVSNARPEVPKLPEQVGDRLSPRGRDQARAAAEALASYGITEVLTSPLRRARETAAAVGERLDLPVAVLPLARELREEEGDEFVPNDQLLRGVVAEMAAHADEPDYSVGGSESFNGIADRVGRVQAELSSRGEVRTLVVTHGIFIRFFFLRALLGERFGAKETSSLWNLRSRNCGLSHFELQPDGGRPPGWTCVTWMSRPWDPP